MSGIVFRMEQLPNAISPMTASTPRSWVGRVNGPARLLGAPRDAPGSTGNINREYRQMKRTFLGLAMIAAGFAAMAAAVPTKAHAGSVVDELRSRGLSNWVDRYVEEDNNGKVSYKSSKSSKSTTSATGKTTAAKTLKAKAPSKRTLKKASKKKNKKKLAAKRSKKKNSRKFSKKSLKKKSTKKLANTQATTKVSSNTKKKYKVPSRVKDRLATYGISF